jgi:hypothetical protein
MCHSGASDFLWKVALSRNSLLRRLHAFDNLGLSRSWPRLLCKELESILCLSPTNNNQLPERSNSIAHYKLF